MTNRMKCLQIEKPHKKKFRKVQYRKRKLRYGRSGKGKLVIENAKCLKYLCTEMEKMVSSLFLVFL